MAHQGFTENEYGTRVSNHVCDTCGVEFTLTPAVDPDALGWESCLGLLCTSYDATRDVDQFFDADSNVTSLHGLMDGDGNRVRPVKAKRIADGSLIVSKP